MPVTLKSRNSVLIAQIKGEIDHHTAPEIREAIDDAFISAENIKQLILDFSAVSFMDSSGVGLVMGRYRLVKERGGTLEVENLSQRQYKIMKMSGLEALAKLRVLETEKEV